MASCCGGNAAAVLAARMAVNGMPADINTYSGDPVAGLVLMNYLGKNVGSYTFNGNGGRTYQGGDNDVQRQVWAHPSDVAILERTSKWVVAPPPPKEEPRPFEATIEPVETIAAALQVEAVATMTVAPEVKAVTDSVSSAAKKKGKR